MVNLVPVPVGEEGKVYCAYKGKMTSSVTF